MVRMSRRLAALAACVVLVGCSQPITVGTIQLGRSLNVDSSVASLTSTFKPNETVYVAILNPERGEGTIGVKWYYGMQLLSEREKQVKFKGAGATEFHLQSAAGFPVGDYRVEVLLDGQPAGSRNFNVTK
ncbi:MAG TPA: hypothetical protein VMW48_17315 [Vicinamibacterales bacterium]|nr:hypothetical protein [Vicinamibacterales bacterium]